MTSQGGETISGDIQTNGNVQTSIGDLQTNEHNQTYQGEGVSTASQGVGVSSRSDRINRLQEDLDDTRTIEFDGKKITKMSFFMPVSLTDEELKHVKKYINWYGFHKIVLNTKNILINNEEYNVLTENIFMLQMYMVVFRKNNNKIDLDDKVELYLPKILFSKKVGKFLNYCFKLFESKVKDDKSYQRERDIIVKMKNNLIKVLEKYNSKPGSLQGIIVNLLDSMIRTKVLFNKVIQYDRNIFNILKNNDNITKFLIDDDNSKLLKDIIPSDCKSRLIEKEYIDFNDMCLNSTNIRGLIEQRKNLTNRIRTLINERKNRQSARQQSSNTETFSNINWDSSESSGKKILKNLLLLLLIIVILVIIKKKFNLN